jgi:Arc/MetJ-type ribon-helix-helix transcriptional regulator
LIEGRSLQYYGVIMHNIRVKFNQQQLELLDRAVEAGIAPSREALIRKALREYASMATAKPDDDADGASA